MRFVSELDKMSSANVRQKRQRSRNESGASDKSSNSEASNPTPAKVNFLFITIKPVKVTWYVAHTLVVEVAMDLNLG